MGKMTGFMDYQRQIPEDRSPAERIGDWKEFHLVLDEEQQKLQGARCMDCGVPFCHTGRNLPGGASGCPINNLIPEWNDMIYRGLWKEALQLLQKTNNLPEITSRVCPAPCEGACVLGINEPSVTIHNNERVISDRGYKEGWVVPQKPAQRTGKKVAVVGSGPAGLSAAEQLNVAGHSVVVFERDDRIGGLMMYGIPNMKLDKKEIVQRKVDLMAEAGIEFRTGLEVGVDITVDSLKSEFDAVIMAVGSTKPRDLPVEGRDAKGVHFAMEFLKANTKSLLDSEHADGNYINAADKDVVVIGGGDTGTDCVATSLRHGCKSITQLEIMPRPADSRTDDNPWPQWPKIYKMDYGQKEAANIFGSDPRQYLTMTKKMISDDQGQIQEVHTVQVEWTKNESGQFIPQEVPGSEKVIPAQLVLLAMGFLGPEDHAVDGLKLERDPRSNIQAQEDKYQTSVEGVFAAGDCRRGQSLVVWAIKEGRGAARECDRFLMGETLLP